MKRSMCSEFARCAGVVGLAVALIVGPGAAAAATWLIPYFPAAGSGESPAPRGEIRIVNRSATSTTALIKGKDSGGATGDGTAASTGWTTESIPAGGNIRVTDVQLEDASRLGNGTGVWSLEVEAPDGVHVVPFRINTGGGSPELVPLPVVRVSASGLRLHRLFVYRSQSGDRTYRNVWAYLRHPQSDSWDDCDAILMRPGSTGAFMTVREASWTGGDSEGPTPADGYVASEPYIGVMTDRGDVDYREPEPHYGEVGLQVQRRFFASVREFEAGADSTLYQVRARCSRTVDGTTTSSAVVRRCYQVHSTATCPE